MSATATGNRPEGREGGPIGPDGQPARIREAPPQLGERLPPGIAEQQPLPLVVRFDVGGSTAAATAASAPAARQAPAAPAPPGSQQAEARSARSFRSLQAAGTPATGPARRPPQVVYNAPELPPGLVDTGVHPIVIDEDLAALVTEGASVLPNGKARRVAALRDAVRSRPTESGRIHFRAQ